MALMNLTSTASDDNPNYEEEVQKRGLEVSQLGPASNRTSVDGMVPVLQIYSASQHLTVLSNQAPVLYVNLFSHAMDVPALPQRIEMSPN